MLSSRDLNLQVTLNATIALLADALIGLVPITVFTRITVLAWNENDASLFRAALAAHVIFDHDWLGLHAIGKLSDFGRCIINQVPTIHSLKSVLLILKAHFAHTSVYLAGHKIYDRACCH